MPCDCYLQDLERELRCDIRPRVRVENAHSQVSKS